MVNVCRVGVGVVILKGDYVLLGRRSDSIPSGGKWALVGGSVDEEHAYEAAERECLEEVGLLVGSLDPIHYWADDTTDPRNPYVCVFYGTDAPLDWQPELREPDKCNGWCWFKVVDMPNHEMMMGSAAAVYSYWNWLNPGNEL